MTAIYCLTVTGLRGGRFVPSDIININLEIDILPTLQLECRATLIMLRRIRLLLIVHAKNKATRL